MDRFWSLELTFLLKYGKYTEINLRPWAETGLIREALRRVPWLYLRRQTCSIAHILFSARLFIELNVQAIQHGNYNLFLKQSGLGPTHTIPRAIMPLFRLGLI